MLRRGQSFHFRTGSATADDLSQDQETCCARDASVSIHLAAAQQYLQALRECDLPPAELREAWEAFYRTYNPLVRRTIAACRIQRTNVDDCVQEAWTEVVKKLARFEYDPNRGSFESWLRIVAHRAACHYAYRDYRRAFGRIDQDLLSIHCSRMLGPATMTQRKELCASVRKSLEAFRTRVSSNEFKVLVLIAIEGQTSTEIGKLLGLRPGHVRVLHHRTSQKFREYLAAHPGLADAYGVDSWPSKCAKTSGNQQSCD